MENDDYEHEEKKHFKKLNKMKEKDKEKKKKLKKKKNMDEAEEDMVIGTEIEQER